MNANSSTVSERIYTAIRNDILNKTLVSGEKLTIKSILYEEAQNGRLTDAARKIRIQSTIFSNQYEIKEENRREILKQHEEILSAIRDNRLDRAEDLMRTHVGSSYAKALSILDEEEAASEESSK